MNPALRSFCYLVLVAVAVFCGHRFFALYGQKMQQAARRLEQADSTNETAAATPLAHGLISPRAKSYLGAYAAATLGAVVLLALFLAHDVSQLVAQRFHQALYNEEGEGVADPEYEQAEKAWANGDHLEAIRLIREYLKKNPQRVHAQLRIAEIYEKDLRNPLAAALEYEEVLTRKLDPDRWGWSAIHLCNLYYHMGQPAKAEALLHRIVTEYGETAAAAKARERLGAAVDTPGESAAADSASPAPAAEPGLKLPPGFRPKKS